MYCLPSGKSLSETRPPSFWNCGTAAGEVLNTRHGALPAVMAAPMTSSELLPVGISWPLTCSFGCALFHAATIALPQATSSWLLEYQTLMGPWAALACLAFVPPDPHAAARAAAAA